MVFSYNLILGNDCFIYYYIGLLYTAQRHFLCDGWPNKCDNKFAVRVLKLKFLSPSKTKKMAEFLILEHFKINDGSAWPKRK